MGNASCQRSKETLPVLSAKWNDDQTQKWLEGLADALPPAEELNTFLQRSRTVRTSEPFVNPNDERQSFKTRGQNPDVAVYLLSV